MDWLRRNAKTVTGALVILILTECAVTYYLIQQFHENYLSGDEAAAIALADARYARDDVDKLKIKLGHKSGEAWYDGSFTADGTPLIYRIDAESGEILSKERKDATKKCLRFFVASAIMTLLS